MSNNIDFGDVTFGDTASDRVLPFSKRGIRERLLKTAFSSAEKRTGKIAKSFWSAGAEVYPLDLSCSHELNFMASNAVKILALHHKTPDSCN